MTNVSDLTPAELASFAEIVYGLAEHGHSNAELREIASTGLMTLLRADHVASFVWNVDRQRFEQSLTINQDPVNVARYKSWFQFRDPVTSGLRHRRKATLVDEVVPRDELARTEFYNDFMRHDGLHNGINLFLFDGDRHLGDLRVWRDRGQPDFGFRELAILDALQPFLQKALKGAVPQGQPLTGRERQVAELVTQGLADKQIATRLGISFGTVRTHLSNCIAKLGCTNRTELATYAHLRTC